MTAYYFSSASQDLLCSMLIKVVGGAPQIQYPNVLGPSPAIAPNPAVAATYAADGVTVLTPAIPANPGAGVAGQFYMSILVPDGVTITPPTGVVEDDVNGQAVLGVWA